MPEYNCLKFKLIGFVRLKICDGVPVDIAFDALVNHLERFKLVQSDVRSHAP